ncbi:hypothetical protein JR316_0002669 [Psilocybe cubensis]|uniref:Uncharacterized protein n=2 Tax=Psilocybe cubensis TaxID=181762 RepID=A0ACB8HD64_PSICU|nr:hypothetical protein JR316_0002669 [Psilocybe cubensis]KAH9485754.1 hypothetical protein JR316_0002669 [Psilocybe cubensis]
MFSSPYALHILYGLAVTSISMNLVSLRRSAEDERYRIEAQLSILDSIRKQLKDTTMPLSTDELARLRRLAESSKIPAEKSNLNLNVSENLATTDVSWSAIFRGKGPALSEETSKWEKQDMESIRKEFEKDS